MKCHYCSVGKIQNTKKMKTRESKEIWKKIEGNLKKKAKEIRWVVLIFIKLSLLFCQVPWKEVDGRN